MRLKDKISLLLLPLPVFFFLFASNGTFKDILHEEVDTLQLPAGYPSIRYTALQQLQHYPAPRYLPNNKLLALFNWMDPYYMGGLAQPGFKPRAVNKTALLLQEELALHWNYGIVIPNARSAGSVNLLSEPCAKKDSCCPEFIALANKYPQVPLHVITFWLAVNPKDAGHTLPFSAISGKKIDPKYTLTFDFYGKPKTETTFNLPDSLIKIDAEAQKAYLKRLLRFLTRPINLINENGEEPPGPYQLEAIQSNAIMKHMKDSMKINAWEDFMAIRKLQMRNLYSYTFMKGLPELKNTKFSFYTIEAGPVDRFNWPIMKKCLSPIDGRYYSTPDFYPRWPRNWKDWTGPWHGWKWIEHGRKIEIKGGDALFSPFVAAGWSGKPEEDILPGPWLGLLKCLGVIGAEFYYTGYFNEKAPFSKPEQYTWQAAMPAYAQAITSRYEDVLRNGNVLFDSDGEPVISHKTNDPHVLLTLRKHKTKEKYIIAGTYQPFTHDKNEIPEKKTVSMEIAGQTLHFTIRQQGSVYVYEKLSDGRVLFYQLDGWHENAHPDHWKKEFALEAELADMEINSQQLVTSLKKPGDFSDFVTYLQLDKKETYTYNFATRDSVPTQYTLWVKYKGKGNLSINTENNKKSDPVKASLPEKNEWHWHKVQLPLLTKTNGNTTLHLKLLDGEMEIDKLLISQQKGVPVD